MVTLSSSTTSVVPIYNGIRWSRELVGEWPRELFVFIRSTFSFDIFSVHENTSHQNVSVQASKRHSTRTQNHMEVTVHKVHPNPKWYKSNEDREIYYMCILRATSSTWASTSPRCTALSLSLYLALSISISFAWCNPVRARRELLRRFERLFKVTLCKPDRALFTPIFDLTILLNDSLNVPNLAAEPWMLSTRLITRIWREPWPLSTGTWRTVVTPWCSRRRMTWRGALQGQNTTSASPLMPVG